MGKSVSLGILEALGVPCVDTDAIARTCTAPGSDGLAAVVAAFGRGVLDESGSLRRSRLAEIVFGDAGARERLEAILHPRIGAVWRSQVATWRRDGCSRAAVIIPLLFEKGYEAEFSSVVCLACTGTSQHRRLEQRGWTPPQIASRSAAQWPVVEKMRRARFVVWTEGSLDCHRRQWERILDRDAASISGFPA